MSENKDVQTNSSGKIDRREFLKLGGLSLASLLVPAIVSGKKEGALRNAKNIETPHSTFYPLYERHDRPLEAKDIEKLLPLDIFFYELQAKSRTINLTKPATLAHFEIQYSTNPNDKQRLIPQTHLDLLKNNLSLISFEGFKYTESVSKELEKHHPDSIPDALLARAQKGRFNYDTSKVNKIFEEMVANPDSKDNFIFFRNLVMARKLQFLGEMVFTTVKRKARIGFKLGNSHEGIENHLELGKQDTLSRITKYPKEFLSKIVELNGGLDDFCSAILLSPKGNEFEKTILRDNQLKENLQKKLSG